VERLRKMVIGLGGNLGDRRATIERAVDALRADPALCVVTVSKLYETAPVGGPPQGDYLNGAVLVETALSAREVLDRLLAVEQRLGRVRRERNGPRTIDLDLLWIDGESVDEPGLEVPHPRLAERAFALHPMLDVAPDARDPRSGVPYSSLDAARKSE
jgi:2-amino-4-hydroxy-6-hydroxymethyldihydropteridine diphosphokinase